MTCPDPKIAFPAVLVVAAVATVEAWVMRRSLASGVAFALLVTLSFSPGTARADTAPGFQVSGQPAPAGASPAPRPRRIGLIVGGLVTFAVPYTLGVWAAFASTGSTNEMCPCPTNNNGAGDLLIPVAGPWMAIAASPKDAALFSFLGIVQATGVALTIGGIVRYVHDGAPAEGSGDAPGAHHAWSRPSGFMSFGVLPTRDGAFGFLSGRM
jgi:hypothetical protein